MLSTLGRRIERLFYLGFALILLCFVEVYLSSAAVFFHQSRETVASFYLNHFESKFQELTQLYEKSSEPEKNARKSNRAENIAGTRAALGLSPAVIDNNKSGPSYQASLKKIFESYVALDGPEKRSFSGVLSSSRSPAEIIEKLRGIRATELKKNGLVWGIETPRLFSINYGKADYAIPAQFLAFASFSALAPLILAWLGSFYVTRKRELLLIRELHDFRQSFPHLLNIFAVTFANLARSLGIHQSRRSQFLERRIGGVVSAVFRSAVVLIIAAPMLLCLVYSFYNLYGILQGDNLTILIFGVVLVIMYSILSLQILIQESVLLYKKDFYA